MSKLIIMLLATAGGLGGIAATAGTASAQVYVDSGSEVYVGDRVQVYGNGAWYPATVVGASGYDLLVQYTWGAQEWVDSSRVSLSGYTVGVAYQPAIQVYWGSRWIDARLIASTGGRYHVHFGGRDHWIDRGAWRHRGYSGRHFYNAHRGHGHGYRNVVNHHHRPQWRDNDRGGRRDHDRGRGNDRGRGHRNGRGR